MGNTPPKRAHRGIEARRARVLVIDLDPSHLAWLAAMLSVEHDVVVSSHVWHVVAHIAEGRQYDLILCALASVGPDWRRVYSDVLRIAPDQADRMVFFGEARGHDVPFHMHRGGLDKGAVRAAVAEHLGRLGLVLSRVKR